LLQKVPILILFDFPKKIVISIIVTSLLLTVYEDWLPINELCSRHIYSNRLILIRPNLLLYCQTFKARVLFSLCQLLDASTHNKSILCICSSHLILQGEGTARHQATVSKNDTALASAICLVFFFKWCLAIVHYPMCVVSSSEYGGRVVSS